MGLIYCDEYMNKTFHLQVNVGSKEARADKGQMAAKDSWVTKDFPGTQDPKDSKVFYP
jgi:hypothetical protein